QGFEMTRIRTGRLVTGLRPQHLAAVRAAGMIAQAKVGGAFEGSPDLRSEPGDIAAGDFRFEIGGAESATLVLQAILAPVATASRPSRVDLIGGTHVADSPSFHCLARHHLALLDRFGLHARATLERAGF